MEPQRIIFKFLPLWTVANVIGWGFHSFYLVSQNLSASPRGGLIGLYVLLGCVQWLVLKKFFGVDSNWLWISAITYGVLFLLLNLLHIQNKKVYILLVFGILMILGFLQRSVLNYYFYGSFLWVLSSPIAGVLGVISVGGTLPVTESSSLWEWPIFGLVYGLITGGVLTFMYTITASGKA